jgi:hypothetical protein
VNKENIKDVLIIGSICTFLCSIFSCVLVVSLLQLSTFLGNLDLSFLLDDDFSNYEDIKIEIAIVEKAIQEPVIVEAQYPKPTYRPRFQHHTNPRISNQWISENDLHCIGATFVPMLGWQCPSESEMEWLPY